MNNIPTIKLKSIVLDCPDIQALSDFYIRMLGWEKDFVEEGDFLDIRSPLGGVKIAFQTNADYVPPVWPEEPDAQQQMLHIDFAVQSKEDMERAVEHAISCGATKADTQYCDEWTVMLDPAGHPFCFVVS
jgi:catechol 2,3-dioxygenase-like lactoylglutathione lyase family enzyme